MTTLANFSEKSIAELYAALITKGDPRDLLPFLSKYTDANKATLQREIVKAREYWIDYINLSSDPVFAHLAGRSGWGRRANDEQFDIIILSAIAVLEKKEITRWDETLVYLNQLDNPLVLEIIEWAKPTWINTYLLSKLRPLKSDALNYSCLRLREDHRLITFDPELFALSLASFSTLTSTPEEQQTYIEEITNDPIAYQRDVPLLFDYETAIHKQLFAGTPGSHKWDTAIWERIFTKLLAEGKMDRAWFIENCILVQTKDWDVNLRSFFRKRLADVSPSETELLVVQYSIFACLKAPLSAVVAFGVGLILKMWNQETFDFQSLLEFAKPVTMRTDCKGAIRDIQTIFKKAAAQKPELKTALSLLIPDNQHAG